MIFDRCAHILQNVKKQTTNLEVKKNMGFTGKINVHFYLGETNFNALASTGTQICVLADAQPGSSGIGKS